MLRTILLGTIFSGSLFFSACNNSDYTTASDTKDTTTAAVAAKKDTVPVVGNDADEHGCKASAGYNWSVLKNDCVRIFESGIRLMPQDPGLNKTLAAFVIFKSDND